ncbi:MAG: hypothetical protein GX914_01910 [Erysipelotrichia bacterium]|nr:hypothetical protein [Erysipelotrichia bacterium]
MKKIIKLILIVSFIFATLIGCDKKEVSLDPISETQLDEYLAGRDPFIEENDIEGYYNLISRICDKKTDEIVVTFEGSSLLIEYTAKYQVKLYAVDHGWKIESFDILESNQKAKEITPSMLKNLIEGVDKNVTEGMKGSYSVVSQVVEDGVIKFTLRFNSNDGTYSAEYEGEAIIEDGELKLQKVVINTISDDSKNGEGETLLSNNYDPNKKAADYGYKAPAKPQIDSETVKNLVEENKPGFNVTKVKYKSQTGPILLYEITLEKRHKYVKDVEEWQFGVSFIAMKYNIVGSEKISATTNSNFEGVYVNKANGSYIIMHENWKIELHEFYIAGGQLKEIVLNEYHSISSSKMTWKNRKKIFKNVWTDGAEPESFAVNILSINELQLNANILSSKSGDVFVKVED